MQRFPDASISGFTEQVLATLIVADQWMSNADIIIVDDEESSEEKKAREEMAEGLKAQGNEAMKKQDYASAIMLYTDALDLTPKNPILLSNRSAAYISTKEYEMGRADAQAAVDADPTYTKGWSRLGLAKLELGDIEGSMGAYKRGMEADEKGGSAIMRQGYENARKQLEKLQKTKGDAIVNSVGQGKKKPEKNNRDAMDEAWDIRGKRTEMHSLVHEKQIEGLLRFAELLRWPFMNETREYAEDVYGDLRGGKTLSSHIFDWIFGLVLPGQWAAYKLITVLVLCTPSLAKEIGESAYYHSGLSLPKQSYWRSRTALGRVLGSLPGVKSVCGWVGPCPPINGPHRRWIRPKARRVAPPPARTFNHNEDDHPIRLKEGEDIQQWMAEIKDDSRWAAPEPPVRQMTTCTLESISVKELPLSGEIEAKRSKMTKIEIEREIEYRASITFKIDNEPPVTYTLYTNPVFITAPPCKFIPAHLVHMRQQRSFQQNVWNVEDLKAAEAIDYDDNGVMVINATGKGAETLARAWCSERGKNAIIRVSGGPCYACAYDAASKKGLGVNVLIWVS